MFKPKECTLLLEYSLFIFPNVAPKLNCCSEFTAMCLYKYLINAPLVFILLFVEISVVHRLLILVDKGIDGGHDEAGLLQNA
jgi:hypothetical protein